jgi:starch synthase
MKILFVASEVSPFAKTGGLADVVGALPKTLRHLGHDVRIFMPLYREVEESGCIIRKMAVSTTVKLGDIEITGELCQTSLGDIPVYLLENREFFAREHLYGTGEGDYPDNHQRFAFFCRGVLDLLAKMDFGPDIIHCHDWQTALIPHILKYERSDDPFFSRTGVVFTIHNLAYQGIFPKSSLAEMGLAPANFFIDRLEYYGKVNLLKGGILAADLITTVSRKYCQEIQTPEMGFGLHGVLQVRENDLYGVLNGLDYEEWNPATDPVITRNYSVTALSGKGADKAALQKKLGLAVVPSVPMFGMVSRLVAQKGLDLLTELLPRFATAKLQLVILGVGDEKYTRLLLQAAQTSDNLSVNIGFHKELAPMVYAGSDMFLMPSEFEPCGLGQLIALRYGSVPVVRKTGGLADTIIDPLDDERGANGFTFDEYSAEAFWQAVTRALKAYGNKLEWKKLVHRGMACDYSGQASTNRYVELYYRAQRKKELSHEHGEK